MWIVFIVSVIVGLMVACTCMPPAPVAEGKPTVTILAPANGSQVAVDQITPIQASAVDAQGVTRIEIKVDGTLVGTAQSPSAQGQTPLMAVQTWTFAQAGSHVIAAQAFNAAGQASDPAAVTVQAVAGVAQQDTPTSPPTAPSGHTPVAPTKLIHPTSVPPTPVPPTPVPPTPVPPTPVPPTPVPPASGWSGWTVVGGNTTDAAPAAAVFGGRLYLFARKSASKIVYFCSFDGHAWSGWTQAQATNVAPAVLAFYDQFFLFVVSNSKQIHVSQFDGHAWSFPTLIGGTTDAAVAATVFGNNQPYLFAKGIADKQIYFCSFDGQEWSGWTAVSGGGTTDVAPAVTVFGGRLYLFTKGIGDKQIYVNQFDGHVWTGWTKLGGTTDVAAAATVFGNRLYLFAKGIADQRIYVNQFDGNAWSGWTEVKGGGTTDVAVAATVFGDRLALFAKGIGDKQIYVNWYKPPQ